ncbi:MAG: FkbM family methyltransferase [Thermomicrobiales bacterium]
MNLEAMVVRAERGPMRKLPPGLALWSNAQLHRVLGEPELKELPRLVRKDSIAVDVGAHFGTYSLALARLVGKQGKVVSIEPIAEDAAMLRQAVSQLRLPVDVVETALSDHSGVATMRIPKLHGYEKTALSSLETTVQASADVAIETRDVPVRTLDEVMSVYAKPVSFIKIDVEGHELPVLAGAEGTIRTHKPAILIEINDDLGGERSATDVFAWIVAQGYHGEFLEDGRYRRPISAFDVTRHQTAASDDVLSDAYVNNFIFLPD